MSEHPDPDPEPTPPFPLTPPKSKLHPAIKWPFIGACAIGAAVGVAAAFGVNLCPYTRMLGLDVAICAPVTLGTP